MKVLICGFRPKNYPHSDTSHALLSSLDVQLPTMLDAVDTAVKCVILPADKNKIPQRLKTLLDSYRPTVCLITNQDKQTSGIALEQVALNSRMFPGIEGQQARQLDKNIWRPAAFLSTLGRLNDIKTRLLSEGFQVNIKRQASNTIGNCAYFEALHYNQCRFYGCHIGLVDMPIASLSKAESNATNMPTSIAYNRRALTLILVEVVEQAQKVH